MECKERFRLLGLYENAVVDASLARNAFNKVAGNAALADHRELLHAQRRTEKEISQARSAYEEHIIEHPIGRSTLCSIPSQGIVADVSIFCPSPSTPVTVRFTPFPADSNTIVLSLLRVPICASARQRASWRSRGQGRQRTKPRVK